MNRRGFLAASAMLGLVLGAASSAGAAAAPGGTAASAADGAGKVATCNFVRVLERMQEYQAYKTERSKKQQTLDGEAQKARNDMTDLQRQLNDLQPESPPWVEKNMQLYDLLAKSEVAVRMRTMELQRFEQTRLRAMYEKVREGAKEVATARGIDLVLNERKNEIPSSANLTQDQVVGLLAQNDVLYAGPKADITNDVLLAVDKKYVTAAPAVAPGK